ncbi:hypothetical protein [Treponema sp. R6D11]
MKNILVICLFLFFQYSNVYGQKITEFVYSNIYGQKRILNLQWRNEHSEIEEAHIHDQIIIQFETRNMSDNENIEIEIWEETDGKLTYLIDTLQGTVKNNIVKIFWEVELDKDAMDINYADEIKSIGYTYIDYIFKIKDTNIQSKPLAIFSFVNIQVIDKLNKKPIRNAAFIFIYPDNERIRVISDENGYILVRNIRKYGKCYLFLEKKDK